MSTLCVKCNVMVNNLAAHMNVSHGVSQPSAHTAPVSQTGKQWCPSCKKSVYWTPGAATGKPRCNICGTYTKVDDDRPTQPVIPVAKAADTIDLVYCTKCGITYSSGVCGKGDDPSFLKRMT